MKKSLVVLLSVVWAMSNAQGSNNTSQRGKVGINTTNPNYTLDVNGSVALETPGDARKSQILQINPNTHQLITGDQTDKPFYYMTYAINLGQKGQDWADNVKLGVDGNHYEMVLLQSFLVKTGNRNLPSEFYELNDKAAESSYIKGAVGRTVAGSDLDIRRVRFKNGWVVDEENGDNWPDHKYSGAFLSIPKKVARLSKDATTGEYAVFLDYDKAACFESNIKYTWIVTFLVMNKNLVKGS